MNTMTSESKSKASSTSIPLPAVALAAVPKRRQTTLELGREIESRGFAGIYCASIGDAMGLSQSLAQVTEKIHFGTSIVNLYMRHVSDYANTAAMIHELSNGRFRFGVGVSHGPVHRRTGIKAGKPLSDMREFITNLREVPRIGDLPPIVVAGLRTKMVALAGELAEGVVFANASRRHFSTSISVLSDEQRSGDDFFIGNMIPTCISDDLEAAAAVNRKTLKMYLGLPNYRNYWKEAGYVEEMEAIEKAIEVGDRDRLPELMTDEWLSDCTLYGPAERILDGLAAWYDAGLRTPILVPSSAVGNQMKAFEEFFELFDRLR
jgi:alkanesulfonate monooxygenase SsuD/methylene tetrahydromethanopterin reductase-like flavin-dependent oxidoreductase (luciferase family)